MSQLKLIDEVAVAETPEVRRIQFCSGDLSKLDAEDAIDVLVVSAFPGSYDPSPGSLIGALHDAGLSVAQLAQDIAVDLRTTFSCWISHPLANRPPGIHFKRVLCFEPLAKGQPELLVGDIFRSLAPFVGDTPPVKTVAIPLVAAGYQGASPVVMLRLITEAAVRWMSIGLPLSSLKIVYNSRIHPGSDIEHLRWTRAKRRAGWAPGESPVRKTHPALVPWRVGYIQHPHASRDAVADVRRLTAVFRDATSGLEKRATHRAGKWRHDVFISYAHEDHYETDWLLRQLVEVKPDLRVFHDRKALNAGAAWQQELYEALDRCRRVVALYSPAYLASKVCLEEFNIAICRNRESAETVLLPIYLYTADLPTYMKLVQFLDCREFDVVKVRAACATLIQEITKDGKAPGE